MSGDQPMSLRFTIVLVLSFMYLIVLAWTDGQAGVDAYKRGDYAVALCEWRPLAGQGDAGAQFYIGTLYAFGRGVPQDYATARQWFEKAADQGHARAQYNLGGLYEFGHGVTQDYMHAYMWYNVAADDSMGDAQKDVATENRDEIAGRMTPAQIAEAQKLAREWKPLKK